MPLQELRCSNAKLAARGFTESDDGLLIALLGPPYFGITQQPANCLCAFTASGLSFVAISGKCGWGNWDGLKAEIKASGYALLRCMNATPLVVIVWLGPIHLRECHYTNHSP